MPTYIFLKLDGVDGESTDSQYAKQMEILSMQWGVEHAQSPTKSSLGGIGGLDKPQFTNLTVTKFVDSASPVLMDHLLKGTQLPEAVVTLCRSGGERQVLAQYTLKNVFITKMDTEANSKSQNNEETINRFPTEVIQIAFLSIENTYNKTNPETGKVEGSITKGWNLKENVAI